MLLIFNQPAIPHPIFSLWRRMAAPAGVDQSSVETWKKWVCALEASFARFFISVCRFLVLLAGCCCRWPTKVTCVFDIISHLFLLIKKFSRAGIRAALISATHAAIPPFELLIRSTHFLRVLDALRDPSEFQVQSVLGLKPEKLPDFRLCFSQPRFPK